MCVFDCRNPVWERLGDPEGACVAGACVCSSGFSHHTSLGEPACVPEINFTIAYTLGMVVAAVNIVVSADHLRKLLSKVRQPAAGKLSFGNRRRFAFLTSSLLTGATSVGYTLSRLATPGGFDSDVMCGGKVQFAIVSASICLTTMSSCGMVGLWVHSVPVMEFQGHPRLLSLKRAIEDRNMDFCFSGFVFVFVLASVVLYCVSDSTHQSLDLMVFGTFVAAVGIPLVLGAISQVALVALKKQLSAVAPAASTRGGNEQSAVSTTSVGVYAQITPRRSPLEDMVSRLQMIQLVVVTICLPVAAILILFLAPPTKYWLRGMPLLMWDGGLSIQLNTFCVIISHSISARGPSRTVQVLPGGMNCAARGSRLTRLMGGTPKGRAITVEAKAEGVVGEATTPLARAETSTASRVSAGG